MIQVPKALIIAQKRSGSHFLQDSIKCAALTGVTYKNYIKEGGAENPVDSSIFRMKNTDTLENLQFLRYHGFNDRDRDMVSWLRFSEYIITRVPKLIILNRKDRFKHALSDWFNDKIFEREVKRKNPHDDWTEYREDLIRNNKVDYDTFQFYFHRVNVFYRLFESLYSDYKGDILNIHYEDFVDIESVVERISDFVGFDVKVDGDFPVWREADYSLMDGYYDLRGRYV